MALAYVPKTAITACTIGIPHFVIVSNMSSHVFRNMRLGFYQDYTLTSAEMNRAVQGHSQSRHEMVFSNPITSAMRGPEDGEDLEAGGLKEAGHVEDLRGLELKGSSNREII